MSCVSVGATEGARVKTQSNGGENIAIEESVFPNEKFRTYVEEYVDLNQNKILEENEIETMDFTKTPEITSICCGDGLISSLKLQGCAKLLLLHQW